MAKNVAKFIVEIDEKGKPVIGAIGKDFEGLERKVSKTSGVFKTLKANWLAITAAFAAGIYTIAKLTKGILGLANAYGIQEAAERRLEAVIIATNHAAGLNIEQLVKMAGAMQKVTTFGDEMILEGMAILATFKEIKGEAFEKTMMAALDMSVVLKQDLRSGLIQLGKALNDPITGITALRRVGVSFSKEQTEVIKALAETGQIAKAQALILEELNSEFGGAAQAEAETYAGKIKQLGNVFSDLKETIGAFFIPALTLIIKWIKNIIYRIQDWAKTHREAAQDIVRNSFMKIIEGLMWVSHAIETVSTAWRGWEELIVSIRILIAKFLAYTGSGLLKFAKLMNNIFGIMSEDIKELEKEILIFGSLAEEDITKLYEVTDRKNPFKIIRKELDLLMEEVQKRWPELTKLTIPSREEGPPALPPGEDPELEILLRRIDAMEEMRKYQEDFEKWQAELQKQKMTSWDLEMERIGEMIEKYGLLGAAVREFINVKNLENIMVQTVGSSIQAAILGYENVGKSLKKALAETLAAITAESAVRSLFNTALGFSYLALHMYSEASKAFTAAKVFAMTAAMAGAAAAVARAAAGGPESAEQRGYAEARGAGVAGLAHEGEAQEYAQKMEITIINPIGTEEWFEENLVPIMKKVARRDTEIVIKYGQ
jgi:Phage-related minor tail protein